MTAIAHSLSHEPTNQWIDLIQQVSYYDEFKSWLATLPLLPLERLKVNILLSAQESVNTQALTIQWNQCMSLMENNVGFSLHFLADSEPHYWWSIIQDMIVPLHHLPLDYFVVSGYLAVELSKSCQSHNTQQVTEWMVRAEFIYRLTAQFMSYCQFNLHRTFIAQHWMHIQCSMIELGFSKLPIGILMETAQTFEDTFAQSIHIRCKKIQLIPLIEKNDWETVQKQLAISNESKKSLDMDYILDILNSLGTRNVFESLNRLQVSILNGEMVKGMQMFREITQQEFNQLDTKGQVSVLVSLLGIVLQLKDDQVPVFYQENLQDIANWMGISLSTNDILEKMAELDQRVALKYRAFASRGVSTALFDYVKTMLEHPNDIDHCLRTIIFTMDNDTQLISKHFGLTTSQLQTQLTSASHWVALPIKKTKNQQALQHLDHQLRLLCIQKRQLEQSLKQMDVSIIPDELQLPLYSVKSPMG